MHSPQSMHLSEMICALPPRTRIAWVGQRLMQLVQPTHFSLSSVTEWKNRSITKPPCFRQTWTVRVMVVPAPMTVSIAI